MPKKRTYSVADLSAETGATRQCILYHAKKMTNWPWRDGKLVFTEKEFRYWTSWVVCSTRPRRDEGAAQRKKKSRDLGFEGGYAE